LTQTQAEEDQMLEDSSANPAWDNPAVHEEAQSTLNPIGNTCRIEPFFSGKGRLQWRAVATNAGGDYVLAETDAWAGLDFNSAFSIGLLAVLASCVVGAVKASAALSAGESNRAIAILALVLTVSAILAALGGGFLVAMGAAFVGG
jgi:hypothetical protein